MSSIPIPATPNNHNSGGTIGGPSETFWWDGGTFYIDGAPVTFPAAYYTGYSADSDGDGIPDAADP